MVKMMANLAQQSQALNLNQLEHSILRNFGGFEFNPKEYNPLEIFKQQCPTLFANLHRHKNDTPPVDPVNLMKSCLSGKHTSSEKSVKFPFYYNKNSNANSDRRTYTFLVTIPVVVICK